MDADGVECLSFSQATTAARSLVEIRRRESLAKAKGAPLTVRSAVDAYVEGREKVERARGGRFDTGNRMRKHVLSDAALADKEMHALTEADLQDWRGRLPDALARASVMRVNNDLKAALNAAASKHARHLRDLNASHIGVVIKNGLAAVDAVSPVARDKAILPDADIRRIVEASEAVDCEDEWGGDFARLVLVLAATGSRFSQVIRLTVADVQTSQSRLMIPVSHKGRGEKHTTRT
ncbi:MAG: integrase, partial [Mesorhizobium sp.]